jgi:phosphate transporter
LLLDAQEHANHIFIPALDREVARITEFYVSKESALYEAANRLLLDIKSTYGDFDEDEEETVDDTRRPSLPVQERRRLSIGQQLHQRRASHISVLEPGNTQLTTTSIGSWISDSGQATLPLLREPELREEALQIYVALVDLESYVDLNFTAFNKILKKYDKITRNRLRKSYIQESVLTAYPFYAETKARLKKQIQRVAVAHGVAAQFSDPEENMRFLKQHIRERVIFTRNTVWREMIGQERKVTAIDVQQVGEPVAPKYICGVRVPRLLMTRQVLYGVPSVLVFAYLLHTETLPDVAQNNCFALLVFASLLWAFEILPLFVTSLLVPFLIVLLGVLRDNEGERMPASMAARYIFSSMFNSVIVLLLGGFTIAAALSKYDIAKRMASAVLSHAGTRPSTVLLFSMLVAAFSSMWISNVAAPVLCFSLVQASYF